MKILAKIIACVVITFPFAAPANDYAKLKVSQDFASCAAKVAFVRTLIKPTIEGEARIDEMSKAFIMGALMWSSYEVAMFNVEFFLAQYNYKLVTPSTLPYESVKHPRPKSDSLIGNVEPVCEQLLKDPYIRYGYWTQEEYTYAVRSFQKNK